MDTASGAGLNFGARNEEYKQFRIAYPPALFQQIFSALPPARLRRSRWMAPVPGRTGTAVDLGSGTGLSTVPLAARFARVLAVEPDARMAAQIPRRAGLEVILSRAEDLELPTKSVDLVTCGTAFYWMDGPLVLDRAAAWLAPHGVLAIFRYLLPEAPDPVARLVEREFRDRWDAFRHPRLRDLEYSWRVVQACPAFAHQRRLHSSQIVPMDAAAFVGFWGSTSYVGAYLRSEECPSDYLDALRREVGPGEFPVNFPLELILAQPAGGK